MNKIVAQRNFCNKIFNAVKFVLIFCHLDQDFIDNCQFSSADAFLRHCSVNSQDLTLVNRLILNKLVGFVHQYNKAMR